MPAITTAAPTIAISAILIAIRLSGGVTSPLRRLEVERRHWLTPESTTTTARMTQPTTGVMSP